MIQPRYTNNFNSLNTQWVMDKVKSRQLPTESYQKNGINPEYTAINELAKKFQLNIKLLESSTDAGKIGNGDAIDNELTSDDLAQFLEIISVDPDDNPVFLKVLGQTEESIAQAIANDCCLIVENEEDCQAAQSLGSMLGKKVKVGFWLDQSPSTIHQQAFLIENLELIADVFPISYPNLSFQGFNIKIDELSLRKKSLGLKQGLLLAELLLREGINTSYIHLNDSILSSIPKTVGNLSILQKKSKNAAGYSPSDPVRMGYLTQIDRQDSEKHFKRRSALNGTFKTEAYLKKILIQPFSYQELIFQALRSRGISLIVEA
jgi:hypothetical protein